MLGLPFHQVFLAMRLWAMDPASDFNSGSEFKFLRDILTDCAAFTFFCHLICQRFCASSGFNGRVVSGWWGILKRTYFFTGNVWYDTLQ